jgi:ATP-binding cassette subfamily B protein
MIRDSALHRRIRHTFRLDRAARFVWKAAPQWTIASLGLVIVQAIFPLLSLYLIKLIVDGVTQALGSADPRQAFGRVLLFIGLAGGVALLNALTRLGASLVREAQAMAVADYMYTMLHAQSIRADLSYYENPSYFDTLHRAQMEGPHRPTSIVNGLMNVARSGITLVAMAGLLFTFHWLMAVVLVAAALPGVAVRVVYTGHMFRWQRERTKTERMVSYLNWILTSVPHAKEIRLFGHGKRLAERVAGLRRVLRREKLNLSKRRSLGELVAQTGATLAVFGSLAFIAYRAVLGTITLGDMVMYFQAFQKGLGYLRDLFGAMVSLYEDNLFLRNLFEFLDLEPKVKDPDHPVPVPHPMAQGIAVDQVTFQYPSTERPVLQDISLHVAPGEIIALVGANGSGKTTLVKLLCRLYDPDQGAVLMDGVDLRRFRVHDLRDQYSVVFQDYALYHLTARENIQFGNIELSEKDERIVEASRQAGIHDRITRLSKGYDTILGRMFEEGEELSVGEWQKVALARAFLRDAQVIVLDEPTSSMDARSEYEVFEGFRRLLDGRSAVLVSHRFSTVRMADRIYVFEGGRIIEQGSHEELVARGGTYAGLYAKQAASYQQ